MCLTPLPGNLGQRFVSIRKGKRGKMEERLVFGGHESKAQQAQKPFLWAVPFHRLTKRRAHIATIATHLKNQCRETHVVAFDVLGGEWGGVYPPHGSRIAAFMLGFAGRGLNDLRPGVDSSEGYFLEPWILAALGIPRRMPIGLMVSAPDGRLGNWGSNYLT